jgi:hypothetical protein
MVKRLDLSKDDRFCSRNEFTLLTLVLQGKVSEADLTECRETFRKLDADGSGELSFEDLEALARRRALRSEKEDRRRFRSRVRRALGIREPKGASVLGLVSGDDRY